MRRFGRCTRSTPATSPDKFNVAAAPFASPARPVSVYPAAQTLRSGAPASCVESAPTLRSTAPAKRSTILEFNPAACAYTSPDKLSKAARAAAAPLLGKLSHHSYTSPRSVLSADLHSVRA